MPRVTGDVTGAALWEAIRAAQLQGGVGISYRDHFSDLADQYARHRPSYPPELFDELAAMAPHRELVWDCGTGNGQAAVELAGHFKRVVATDPSEEQLQRAMEHPRVQYRLEPAERSSLKSNSVDLTTVGTAVHWFDLDRFYEEVRRVSRERALLAVWTYHLLKATPEIDRWLEHYYREILAGYWPERFHFLDERYQTLPFPFDERPLPEITMTVHWNWKQFCGFLASWSASRRYLEDRGAHPLGEVEQPLSEAWGDPEQTRELVFPLYVRVGVVRAT